MARSNRVLSEAGGSARWRLRRWAMERVRGERAASETGRASISGAAMATLDALRRLARPRGGGVSCAASGPLPSGPPPVGLLIWSDSDAAVGLDASAASGPSKSARDERQFLEGRPPTSPAVAEQGRRL